MQVINKIFITTLLLTLYLQPALADGRSKLMQLLSLEHPGECAAQSALHSTLERLQQVSFPTHGKLVVVNLASQQLTAYENGEVVFEMRAVVGAPETQTPEMQTQVGFVRFNPTWVVPQSIIKDEEWQARLKNPQFLIDYGFIAYDANGNKVSSSREHRISRLVQSASEDNALGLVKFNLKNGNSIYLHDTTAKEGFNQSIRATSHGCVRVQKPFELAGWMLGTSTSQALHMQQAGNRENHIPSTAVNVVIGYFTAWPSAGGKIKYYRDVYGKDRGTCHPSNLTNIDQQNNSVDDEQIEYNND